MRIALLGLVLHNGNMGCVALTYSVIKMLKNIENNLSTVFQFVIVDRECSRNDIRMLCQYTGATEEQVCSIPYGDFSSVIHNIRDKLGFAKGIRDCNVVIDLTEGDSFSDIYGNKRFKRCAMVKKYIEDRGIPLILGPQTYGPFQNNKNMEYARDVIERANLVISRDETSKAYLAEFCTKKVINATDIAFNLPFKKIERKTSEHKLGLNVSGLLWADALENTRKNFFIKVDYHCYIESIIRYIQENTNYKIFLISHVDADEKANRDVYQSFLDIDLVPKFENPVQAKSFISGMDVFIGSRMHATIAALSSGVPVIPASYSRKFEGLFENLNYPYCVDLKNTETDQAIFKTIKYLRSISEIQIAVNNSRNIAYTKLEIINGQLMNALKGLNVTDYE